MTEKEARKVVNGFFELPDSTRQKIVAEFDLVEVPGDYECSVMEIYRRCFQRAVGRGIHEKLCLRILDEIDAEWPRGQIAESRKGVGG